MFRLQAGLREPHGVRRDVVEFYCSVEGHVYVPPYFELNLIVDPNLQSGHETALVSIIIVAPAIVLESMFQCASFCDS
jgi:hypothetical protein